MGYTHGRKWEVYEDRWDYFNMYNNFYMGVKDTEIRINKRRSKGLMM